MCIPHILAGAGLEVEATSFLRRIPEACNWKSTVCAGHEQRRRAPSDFDPSPKDDRDDGYKPRSRTPPNESFSCDEDHHHKHRQKSPSRKGLGNDAMRRALNQISKSPFTLRIEG